MCSPERTSKGLIMHFQTLHNATASSAPLPQFDTETVLSHSSPVAATTEEAVRTRAFVTGICVCVTWHRGEWRLLHENRRSVNNILCEKSIRESWRSRNEAVLSSTCKLSSPSTEKTGSFMPHIEHGTLEHLAVMKCCSFAVHLKRKHLGEPLHSTR